MPLVDVTYRAGIAPEQLRALALALPDAVSDAVECPEEPYDGRLQPGDVEVRFHASGEYDVGAMAAVVEVRSKYFDSRARNRQERCDRLLARLHEACDISPIGVYLTLPVAAWAQDG